MKAGNLCIKKVFYFFVPGCTFEWTAANRNGLAASRPRSLRLESAGTTIRLCMTDLHGDLLYTWAKKNPVDIIEQTIGVHFEVGSPSFKIDPNDDKIQT